MTTITAANSVYLLGIASIFPVAQQLQQYAADAAFATENAEFARVMKGVDGATAAGYIPRLTRQTISLMANSISVSMFETWASQQDAVQEIFPAVATIIIPSIGKKYSCLNGTLTGYTAMSDVKNLVDPRHYVITWGTITPSPM